MLGWRNLQKARSSSWADALLRQAELLGQLREGVRVVPVDAEVEAEDASLTRIEVPEQVADQGGLQALARCVAVERGSATRSAQGEDAVDPHRFLEAADVAVPAEAGRYVGWFVAVTAAPPLRGRAKLCLAQPRSLQSHCLSRLEPAR